MESETTVGEIEEVDELHKNSEIEFLKLSSDLDPSNTIFEFSDF